MNNPVVCHCNDLGVNSDPAFGDVMVVVVAAADESIGKTGSLPRPVVPLSVSTTVPKGDGEVDTSASYNHWEAVYTREIDRLKNETPGDTRFDPDRAVKYFSERVSGYGGHPDTTTIQLADRGYFIKKRVFRTGVENQISKLFMYLAGGEEAAPSSSAFPPATVILDVGANMGWFTLLAAKHLQRHVFAFEPQPYCRYWIWEQVLRNQVVDRVQLYPLALGAGTTNISVPDYLCDPGFKLVGTYANANRAVQLRRLDDMLDAQKMPLHHILLAKIDAEGHEPAILQGAIRLFQQKRICHCIIEVVPCIWTNSRCGGGGGSTMIIDRDAVRVFREFMETHGFQATLLTDAGFAKFVLAWKVSPTEIKQRGWPNTGPYYDIPDADGLEKLLQSRLEQRKGTNIWFSLPECAAAASAAGGT